MTSSMLKETVKILYDMESNMIFLSYNLINK